jgi:putative multiple sugar transport system substrate-binding protein
MQKSKWAAVTLAMLGTLALGACTSGGGVEPTNAGFPAHATIGVLMPEQDSDDSTDAGELFVSELEDAGYTVDLEEQHRSGTPSAQRAQFDAMVEDGAKVIVLGDVSIGALALGTLEEAQDAGVKIIAFDRLSPRGTQVDYGVAYDSFRIGELQAQSLLDGLAERLPGQSHYAVELFSGEAGDDAATAAFEGAMSVLGPKIDDGTLVVPSGAVSRPDTVTDSWREDSLVRMDELLEGLYGSIQLDGVLAPNDLHAQAIIESAQAHGRTIPVVVGEGSDAEAVRSMMAGVQYSTIYRNVKTLVTETVKMVEQLQAGTGVTVTSTGSDSHGMSKVPVNLLEPVLVTQENAAEAYADDPKLAPLAEKP